MAAAKCNVWLGKSLTSRCELVKSKLALLHVVLAAMRGNFVSMCMSTNAGRRMMTCFTRMEVLVPVDWMRICELWYDEQLLRFYCVGIDVVIVLSRSRIQLYNAHIIYRNQQYVCECPDHRAGTHCELLKEGKWYIERARRDTSQLYMICAKHWSLCLILQIQPCNNIISVQRASPTAISIAITDNASRASNHMSISLERVPSQPNSRLTSSPTRASTASVPQDGLDWSVRFLWSDVGRKSTVTMDLHVDMVIRVMPCAIVSAHTDDVSYAGSSW